MRTSVKRDPLRRTQIDNLSQFRHFRIPEAAARSAKTLKDRLRRATLTGGRLAACGRETQTRPELPYLQGIVLSGLVRLKRYAWRTVLASFIHFRGGISAREAGPTACNRSFTIPRRKPLSQIQRFRGSDLFDPTRPTLRWQGRQLVEKGSAWWKTGAAYLRGGNLLPVRRYGNATCRRVAGRSISPESVYFHVDIGNQTGLAPGMPFLPSALGRLRQGLPRSPCPASVPGRG